jgi:hypothetical protein
MQAFFSFFFTLGAKRPQETFKHQAKDQEKGSHCVEFPFINRREVKPQFHQRVNLSQTSRGNHKEKGGK